jgi:PAS domain S-box-containing protein
MNNQTKAFTYTHWTDYFEINHLINAISVNSMIMLTDSQGVFKDVNEQTCAVSGYDRKELINQKYEDLFGYQATDKEHIGEVQRTIDKGEIWSGEVKRFTKQGDIYWTFTIVYPVFDESNKIIAHIGISQIMTRNKVIAEQFDAQNQHLKDFAFSNSHILRHPLATILGLCNLINESIIPTKEANVNEIFRMLQIAAEELDFAVHQMQASIEKAKNEKLIIKNKLLKSKNGVKKVMLVDDDELNHLITQKLIHFIDSEIEVLKFKEVSKALVYLSNEINQLPDLILLDIEMPRINGWSFLKEFEKMQIDVPICILTNSIHEKDKYKAINYESVRSFQVKPLKKEELQSLLLLS